MSYFDEDELRRIATTENFDVEVTTCQQGSISQSEVLAKAAVWPNEQSCLNRKRPRRRKPSTIEGVGRFLASKNRVSRGRSTCLFSALIAARPSSTALVNAGIALINGLSPTSMPYVFHTGGLCESPSVAPGL
jgi:hypothetical protein